MGSCAERATDVFQPYMVDNPRPVARLCAALLGFTSVVAVAQNPRDARRAGPERFTERVVASGLDNPWEITSGPDGHLWVTERTAFRVTRVHPADGSRRVALTIDDGFQSVVQDGLLGLALHPDLARQRGRDFVYLAYTYDRDPGPALVRRVRIRRYTYDATSQTLGTPLDILDDMPAHDDHGGGRLAFGPDGMLYFTRGDLGSNFLTNYCTPIRAQDLPTRAEVAARDWTTYQGKVLRLTPNGAVPPDNPVLAGVRSHVYAFGLRNPQGLAFGPHGRLYASDHGPSTDDEVDLIEPGRNYGWPHVAGFKDDRAYAYANWSKSAPTRCEVLKFDSVTPPASVPQRPESSWDDPRFTPPLATLFTVPGDYDFKHGTATIGPGSIDVYTSSGIPGWADSLLVPGMRGGAVYRLKLARGGRRVVGDPLEYFRSANRFRDLAIGPDGRRIYVSTDNFGTTADPNGGRTSRLATPGAIIEFSYVN